MKYLKVILAALAVVALLVACGPKLPQAEVDAATKAFEEAKAAKAEAYAPNEFKAASDAYNKLQENLKAKDYGKTKDLATALQNASNKAKEAAKASMEAAKAGVAKLAEEITALLPDVKVQLGKAEKAGARAKVDVKPIKELVNSAEKTVSDAKASSDYLDAKNKLTSLKEDLEKAQKALNDAGFKK
ncbi:MAG: hypothetical protein N2442_05960 [Spirochaetes bacterium]|nr:hypothetical protein [Spirochaetota bacterium]